MPNINNTIVSAGNVYSLGNNMARRFIRLKNGWLVAAVKDTTAMRIKYFKSTDNGNTWIELSFSNNLYSNSYVPLAMVPLDSVFFMEIRCSSSSVLTWTKINAETGLRVSFGDINSGDTNVSECTIDINPAGTELHVCWTATVPAYSYSTNLKYSKCTINADGSFSWSAQVLITSDSVTGNNFMNPCIIVDANGAPHIFTCFSTSGNNYIMEFTTVYTTKDYTGNGIASGWGNKNIFIGSNYYNNMPSACVDKNGVIHLVWFGYDSTDNSRYNVKYVKTTNNGVSWSTMEKLTTGNLYHQYQATVTVNKYNKVFVVWIGVDPAVITTKTQIRMISNDGSGWSQITTLTNSKTYDLYEPTTILDKTLLFSTPLIMYLDTAGAAVRFMGNWISSVINVINKVFPTINWNISGTDVITTARVKINNILQRTYPSPSGNLQYDISLYDLVTGNNDIILEIENDSGAIDSKLLKANKAPKNPYNINESQVNISGQLSIVGADDNESFVPMDKKATSINSTSVEAQFIGGKASNAKVTQKFTLKRSKFYMQNLLGTIGNCESTTGWTLNGHTVTLEPKIKMFGNNSFKVTIASGSAALITREITGLLNNTKYFCISAYILNGNAINGTLYFQASNPTVNKLSTPVTSVTTFNRVFIKLNPSQISLTSNSLILYLSGAVGQYGYFDGLMINEITEAEYNDAGYRPPEYTEVVKEINVPITKITGAIG